MTPDQLAGLAREAATLAYAPYSNFRVGAVAVASSGEIYRGTNVENAAYPASSCAEATAVASAASAGVRKLDTVVVACIDVADIEGAYPCGRCRQIMWEFGVDKVIVATATGEVREHQLAELLPHGFKLGPTEGRGAGRT